MRNVWRQKALWTVLALVCATVAPSAQKPVTVSFDSVFYGDNGEFFSPFRTGETIVGSWQRVTADLEVNNRATLKLGVYTIERNGDENRFQLVRPVASLVLGTTHHSFIMGTIETDGRPWGMGPDRTTPHGLLPPLGVETLWFSRAYEAGVQWRTNTERVQQDVWFDYQKLNTPDHRELFDGGVVGRVQRSDSAPVALVYQFHVVHHGGQQFHTGPVSDSFGYGPGLLLRRGLSSGGAATIEGYTLFSYDRPNRQLPELTVEGKAIFVRAAVEQSGWRGHAIMWRGATFLHEAGDSNYLSEYPDGTNYLKRRDYAEAGIARLIKPAPGIDFEASARAHLVQGKWGYSYRLMATLHLALWRASVP